MTQASGLGDLDMNIQSQQDLLMVIHTTAGTVKQKQLVTKEIFF